MDQQVPKVAGGDILRLSTPLNNKTYFQLFWPRKMHSNTAIRSFQSCITHVSSVLHLHQRKHRPFSPRESLLVRPQQAGARIDRYLVYTGTRKSRRDGLREPLTKCGIFKKRQSDCSRIMSTLGSS